jgi:signal transduction histidine kinase
VIAKVEEGALLLTVADNGRGGVTIEGADARSSRWGPSSSGLQGLSERVRTVDGT